MSFKRDIFAVLSPMLTGIGVFVLCVLVSSALAQSQRQNGARQVDVPVSHDPDSMSRQALHDSHLYAASEAPDASHQARRRDAVVFDDAMPRTFEHTAPNRLDGIAQMEQVFAVLDDGKRPLRIYHLGDSHVAGKTFPVAVRDELEAAWGSADNPRRGAGITFRYAGRNGAQSFHLVERGYLRDVADFAPDLLIVSLGTNEAHGANYSEDQHRQQLADFFAELRRVCPRTTIMMTTPPGDYFRRRPNPALPKCVRLITEFCATHNLVCWNLWQICGGDSALDNYRRLQHQRPDGVHFTPEGYTLHGRLLAQAILAAYNGDTP